MMQDPCLQGRTLWSRLGGVDEAFWASVFREPHRLPSAWMDECEDLVKTLTNGMALAQELLGHHKQCRRCWLPGVGDVLVSHLRVFRPLLEWLEEDEIPAAKGKVNVDPETCQWFRMSVTCSIAMSDLAVVQAAAEKVARSQQPNRTWFPVELEDDDDE
jgi:hypothetical protein